MRWQTMGQSWHFVCRNGKRICELCCSLAEAAETFDGHNDRNSEGIKKFTQNLQIVARGGDLSQMRRELAKRIAEFKVTQEEMSRDVNGLISGMQKELCEFENAWYSLKSAQQLMLLPACLPVERVRQDWRPNWKEANPFPYYLRSR